MNQHDIDPLFAAAHYQDGRDLNCHAGKSRPAPWQGEVPQAEGRANEWIEAIAVGLVCAMAVIAAAVITL